MPSPPKRIAIIQGHPDPEGHHFCHAGAEAYTAGAREAGHQVDIIDVARLGFPFLRSLTDLERGPVPESIREAQPRLSDADRVVMIFQNGAMPTLLKNQVLPARRRVAP